MFLAVTFLYQSQYVFIPVFVSENSQINKQFAYIYFSIIVKTFIVIYNGVQNSYNGKQLFRTAYKTLREFNVIKCRETEDLEPFQGTLITFVLL